MNRVINILLVEDDHLDVIDLQRTLDKMRILYKLKVAHNGEEAINLLEEKSNPIFSGLPDILLLDLNMPRMNGIEFLQRIRNDARWKDLKVFVLTTSDESEEKALVKSLGVAGYILKPLKVSNTNSMDAFNLMIDLMNM
jgi:CheY-like chemotaxis protein